MKVVKIIMGVLATILIIAIIGFLILYNNGIKAYDTNSKEIIQVEITSGNTYYSIADTLYSNKLINSKLIYKLYLKLNPPSNELKAGTYNLSQNMDLKTIIETLGNGGASINPDEITITFNEGLNMRAIAKVIAQNTNNTEEDVFNLLKDRDYLNELIDEYWFIEDDILNKKIYYSLEGYLFPNTYNFKNKDVTVKDIFKVMLDEMEKQLEPYKEDILKSEYSVHELLTLASIVELEALNTNDRKTVAGVFYNRLDYNMSLGSDVTTYYAAKVDMGERDLYKTELNDVNDYNTRPQAMAGKLPVGAICNPSISSIEATIYPSKTSYLYFVADKNGKVYYTKSNAEHEQKVAELKAAGLWYTY